MKYYLIGAVFIAFSAIAAEVEFARVITPTNQPDFEAFKQQYIDPDGGDSLRKALNKGELRCDKIFTFNVGDGTVQTNEYCVNFPFLKTHHNLYELERAVITERNVVSSYRFEGPLLFLSITSTKSIISRKVFEDVPEWNIGEPDIFDQCEFGRTNLLMLKGWNIVINQVIDGVPDIKVMRFKSDSPCAEEFNSDVVTVQWIPVSEIK